MKSTLYRGTITKSDWIAALAFVLVLAVVAVFYVFVLRAGQQERIDQANADIKRLQGEIVEAEKIRDRIDELREEKALYEQVVLDFEKRLPSTREIPYLVSVFEDMARQESLRVEVRPGNPQKDARKETIPYDVRAFGNFYQIVGFINRIERYERYLKISDLTINEQQQGESEALFKLSTYRFLQKTEAEKPQPADAESQGKGEAS